jgi:alkylated DNA repair dioxygenase AlkB
MMRTLAGGATLALHEDFLAPAEADAALREILAATPWQAREITLFGKKVMQPRLTAWMGDEGAIYTYSGLRLEPIAWTPLVAELRARAESVAGARFNSVLLNLYRSGVDSMGFHADDEPELGPEPIIASVSLGAVRRFVLRPRRKKGTTEPVTLALPHGSLLVMAGPLQRDWVHGVPKELRVHDPRVNLTFRRIVGVGD